MGANQVPLRWRMLAVLFLVRLAMGFQFQSVASAAPYLVTELGMSYVQIGTLIGLFLLPGVFFAIPSGVVTRAISNKNLLMAGAATMAAGGVAMALAQTGDGLMAGRLLTGVGGTIFNVILTKMVTEWFFEREIVTALSIMLTAWPIGISIGLLTQAPIADAHGWPWAFHATAALALFSLVLTLVLYRDPPRGPAGAPGNPSLGLPHRQLVHVCVVSLAWALFNTALIILVSFAPGVLMAHGYSPPDARTTVSLAMWATLLSIPLGGRVLEVFGRRTAAIIATLGAASVLMAAISQGMAPGPLCLIFGLVVGVPAGALVALSSEAVTPENRGPGLGVFYTGYYIGMTAGPAIAGWARDVSGAAAPVQLGAGMLLVALIAVLVFRALQRFWPISASA